MMAENKTTYILCVSFFVLAAYFQLNSLANTDNAWLIESAKMLLSGQNLYTDYIETNPPFIVYFTAIPLILGGVLGLAAPESYTIFVLTLAAFSFYLGSRLIESNNLKIALLLLFVIFPAFNFGQREHLLVLLITPYFLALLNSARPSVVAAVLMIIGVLLKPYFILFLAFFILWEKFELKQKLFSTRNFAFGITCILYVALIWLFERDYIENTLPMLIQYYDSFYLYRLGIYSKITIFSAPFLLLLLRKAKLHILDNKIIFTLISASIAAITAALQDKGWDNHYFPLHFFMLFALMLMMENSFVRLAGRQQGIFIAGLSVAYLMIMIVSFKNNISMASSFTKFSAKQNIDIIESKAPNGKALVLSVNLNGLNPELLYSSASLGWQYPCLWMLPGMYENVKEDANKEVPFRAPAQQSANERAIFESVVNYFVTQKPEILVVTHSWIRNSPRKVKGKLGTGKFDLHGYFMQDKKFAAEFANYKLQRKFLGKSLYVRKG